MQLSSVRNKTDGWTFGVDVVKWEDTSIFFTVPAKMSYATYGVTVVNSQGQSVLKGAFTVTR